MVNVKDRGMSSFWNHFGVSWRPHQYCSVILWSTPSDHSFQQATVGSSIKNHLLFIPADELCKRKPNFRVPVGWRWQKNTEIYIYQFYACSTTLCSLITLHSCPNASNKIYRSQRAINSSVCQGHGRNYLPRYFFLLPELEASVVACACLRAKASACFCLISSASLTPQVKLHYNHGAKLVLKFNVL